MHGVNILPNSSNNLSVTDWIEYLNISNLNNDKQKIIKFIFLWMKYNDWYQKFNLRDREGALKLSDFIKATQKYRDIKNIILHGEQNSVSPRITKGFLNIPKVNGEINRQGLYDDSGNKIVAYNDDIHCLCKYLQVIYKIRCNFFHGAKSPDETNIALISWAYESLYLLLSEIQDQDDFNFKL